jgi:hypothetical protein
MAAAAAALAIIGSGIAYSNSASLAHTQLIGSYITILASLMIARTAIYMFGGGTEIKLYIIGLSLIMASIIIIPYSLPPSKVASMLSPGISTLIAYSPALAVAALGTAFVVFSIALTAKPRAR